MMKDAEQTIGNLIQYQENPKACIYFCDKRFFRGVMLKGLMEVLEDSETKEMIWRDQFSFGRFYD